MSTGFATIAYAESEEHGPLPVIDVSHPAFALEPSAEEIDRLTRAFVDENRERRPLPPAAIEALRQSRLGRSLAAASGSFLAGLPTYLLKLGPDHLHAPFADIDRRIAASLPAMMTRVRLQDVARLLADGLASRLDTVATRPVRFVNIAGGPAADSWNALILLRHARPDLLPRDRDIAIAVLDPDAQGPAFGARALVALQAPGAPLHGLAARWQHVPYSWTASDRLGPILADLRATEAACAISSEGGLFEYGSDDEIRDNLARLHAVTAANAFVVGSLTRDSEPARIAHAASGIQVRIRSLDAFQRLIGEAGWRIDREIARPFSHQVRVVKSS